MKVSVLDHGYVELVESWGSDERIIEAARMSTGKGFLGWGPNHEPACAFVRAGRDWIDSGADTENMPNEPCDCNPKPGDEKLLRFLYENKHSTPFEMAGMTIEVQAPIFVFREWHRHRTQSYNEMSARYTPLPDVNYVPSLERLALAGGPSKQSQALQGKVFDRAKSEEFRQRLMRMKKLNLRGPSKLVVPQ
jgi:thymidylate synthase (FAD)